jgi:hypothetical protein
MPRKEFASLKALIDHAERIADVYFWEGTPSFSKRLRLLTPDQYEIVDVRTSRGVRRAMLLPKAILKAEWKADAPFREAPAIKRERLRARRAQKEAMGKRSSKSP